MKILVTLAAAMMLAGCVYSQIGTRFDMSKVDQLQPGISTEADAEALLGKPVSVTTIRRTTISCSSGSMPTVRP